MHHRATDCHDSFNKCNYLSFGFLNKNSRVYKITPQDLNSSFHCNMSMELMQKEKQQEFVRIIIGKAKTGFSGVQQPMKIISIRDTNVDEIYVLIHNFIQNLTKQGKKKK